MKAPVVLAIAMAGVSIVLTACGEAAQPTQVPTVAPPRPPALTSPSVPTMESALPSPLPQYTPTAESLQPSPTGGSTAVSSPASSAITPISPQVPEEGFEANVEIRVAEYNAYTDSYGDLHILGLVVNDTGADLTDATVKATLLDASGSEVTFSDATVFLVGLPKGDSVPFEAIIPSPPEFKEIRFSGEAQKADPEAMPVTQLVVEAASIFKGQDGYVVRGQVRNLSANSLNVVAVAVMVRDGAGKLIGVASGDVGDQLEPQMSMPFEIEVPELGGEPSKLEFRAEGYP